MTGHTLRRVLSLGTALLGVALPSLGHDFWIQPSAFQTEPGTVVKVHLLVGSQFPGDPVARDPERIVKFSSFGPTGEQPIAGRDGMDPAGLVRFAQAGVYTLVYQSNPAPVALDGAKFEEYLKEKGLEKVIEARAAAGQSSAGVQERFSRCCKSLLRVGDAPSEGFDRTVGLPLELTALDDPGSATAGSTVRFRLDFKESPCEGLLVKAHNASHPEEVVSARTGTDGTVSLTLPYDGMWLVTAVQMLEAPKDSGADWESLWASLSFQLGDTDPSDAKP